MPRRRQPYFPPHLKPCLPPWCECCSTPPHRSSIALIFDGDEPARVTHPDGPRRVRFACSDAVKELSRLGLLKGMCRSVTLISPPACS